MRKAAICAMALIGSANAALALDPVGEWRVEDGTATINVVNCDSKMWGVVASEAISGGLDKNNPDKAKRTRPTLGIPILLNMAKVTDEKDKWEGNIYNAKDGKTYKASIQVKSPKALEVEGCLALILCGGQTWTRIEPGSSGLNYGPNAPKPGAPKATAPSVPGGAMAPTAAATGPAAASKGAKAAIAPVSEVCLLPEIASAPK